MPEQSPNQSPEYPFGFNPDLFVRPESCLVAGAQPGFIGLGEAVESREELGYDKLREEMAQSGINVGVLTLERKDGVLAHFPVYLDTAEAEVSILPEHFEKARTIVANNEAFADLDERQREQEVVNLAFILASSPADATVFRVAEKGSDLVTYPPKGEVVDDPSTGSGPDGKKEK